MIETIARNGPPEAMLCPAFVCDACRKQVVGAGNVVYMHRIVGDQRESSPLFVAHKGQCDQDLDRWLEAAYPLQDGWTNLWDELEAFAAQLTHNLTNSFADDHEGEYLKHRLVLPKTMPVRL